MDHMWARVGSQLVARVSGPMKFRLVLQPAMAAFFAIRGGLADAKSGNPPYFWACLWDRGHRSYLIKDGWKHIGRVFILALLLDIAYQIIVLRFVYPGEAIIVAIVLAIIPYLILRGPVARLVQREKRGVNTQEKDPDVRRAA
jgi:hypothetical protein